VSPTASRPSPLAADAVAGITDSTLKAVVANHWEFMMRWSPTWATTLGDHRYDDQLAPRDQVAQAKIAAERGALIDELDKIYRDRLTAVDRVTHALLYEKLATDRALEQCKFEQWTVENGGGSVFGELSYLVESHTVKTPEDVVNLIARLGQGPKLVEDTVANLRIGLKSKRVAAAEKVRRAIDQLDGELEKGADAWSMMQPTWATVKGADPWPEGVRDREYAALREVVSNKIVPAIVRYRDFLRDEILPVARTDKEGLAGLPGGEACYRATIASHVGLTITPEELHALGVKEIARTDEELAALGKRVLKTPDLAATILKLRTDKSLYFTSGAEILGTAQKALDRAKLATPKVFSTLPKTDCVMREIPAYEAPYTTIAYYRQPHYDGTKPGEYFVNTYKPETRPRFELEALTWHESIPGHHTQIALSQELGALPAFRKLDGSTAYVEGWALYTERLADEIGLYSSDLDRIGKVSYDAWRSSRLVVDTGLHSLGWTRAQAEAYMKAHTALTETNISNEVDRYIGWPGQALAYKVGQIQISKMRAAAEAKLGAKFDIKGFHAVVLGSGAVTLPVLDELVQAWVDAQAK